uniref:Ferritin/DPS protein domain-containing protein n=1 Tax=Bionectria ochroleuca TaxID=29856 RepID=A0A8H7N9Q1_BIOOC
MHHIFVFASFAASLFLPATAAPVSSRNVSAPNGGDVSILNYALTLEFLERRFYTEGLQNFTAQDFQNAGFSPDFYEQMKTVLKDEQTHVDFLAGALGPKAIQEPTFSFPVKEGRSLFHRPLLRPRRCWNFGVSGSCPSHRRQEHSHSGWIHLGCRSSAFVLYSCGSRPETDPQPFRHSSRLQPSLFSSRAVCDWFRTRY